MARKRRRRVRRFLEAGRLAVATVQWVELEPTAFGQRIARVRYEFEVDGQRYRDSDRVLPAIAQRWLPGDRVQVLYVIEAVGGCDSVVVTTA